MYSNVVHVTIVTESTDIWHHNSSRYSHANAAANMKEPNKSIFSPSIPLPCAH